MQDDPSRRTILQGGLAGAALLAAPAMAAEPAFRLVSDRLMAPESPKPLRDGSVLLVEMGRKTLSMVAPDGTIRVIAVFDGTPNGCAIGPDGAAYVAIDAAIDFGTENGRSKLVRVGDPGGRSGIARVELGSGKSRILYPTTAETPFVAPNDLVFDAHGGFYFTDNRAIVAGGTRGAIYHARADGSAIRRLADVPKANGITLSPDGQRLRVASDRQIVECALAAPGRLATDAGGKPAFHLFATIADGEFDSMAGEADGGLVAGIVYPGRLGAFRPDGRLDVMMPFPPENAVTNIGFGGPGLRTAFVSLTQTGRLVALDWPRPGLELANAR
jgi:gluconolactonase